ncbi:hypothetical protein PVAP13_1KG371000 [Panicum virgatum]|uniref:Uncharacterized protein n=1 Tax=Panicum virgatum TaxID=38727 RepID=A0A8T0XDQ1_PANVG|nr:hypothetical protein PVAP13_1KG371000 [Panicum virgatum]
MCLTPATPAWQHEFPCSGDSRAHTLHITAAWDWRGARPRPRYQHTARMVASGGVNLRTCTANNAGSGRACRREQGDGGWRGVRACLPTKLGSPRYGEAGGGDETAPRRAPASGRGRRRRGPRARWPPPGRRLGWWRWWREIGEGGGALSGRKAKGSVARRFWRVVQAPGVRGSRRERMGGARGR